MSRRKGFVATMVQVQREAERAQRARLVAQQRAVREADRASRANARAEAQEDRERKRLYAEARQAEVDLQNIDLDEAVAELESVLARTLTVDDFIDFETLKARPRLGAFAPGALADPEPPPEPPTRPPEPSGIAKLSRKAKEHWSAQVVTLAEAYRDAMSAHALRETQREQRLVDAQAPHNRRRHEERTRILAQHAEVDAFRSEFDAGLPDAIVEYYALVLQASAYPEGFPRGSKVAFVPESRQLVVELDLPSAEVVPTIAQYRYIKAKDDVSGSRRPENQRRQLYGAVIAQMILRTLHELFEADRGRYVDTIVLNGYVDAIDPGTGREIRPCLVTVRTTRDAFLPLDLARVDPVSCLRALNASLSRNPTELSPVRPVLEFSMVDARFVEESDIMSDLDQRPNLMELTPSEFESLITNLFEKMGLETRLTRPSRDGGVDCVAFDPRPVFGGKVIIQAKRYKNTVGVSAVRDLFGTVHNEGASKGILVTTSGYGKASFQFAENKPLELLSGSNLLYLLAEYSEIEAKIEPPEGWTDPQLDS